MTPEQKRIAIAEACGWEWYIHVESDKVKSAHPGHRFMSLPGEWMNYMAVREAEGSEPVADTSKLPPSANPPDYFNSLDAMHEAEKRHGFNRDIEGRGAPNSFTYWRALFQETRISGNVIHCATAAERAEAFGKTLKLW